MEVPVAATNLTIVVSRRYQETAVPLSAVDAVDGAASHFHGEAGFLKDALQFDAHVSLPVSGRWKTSWFDPWVVPTIIGVPPNEVAKFVCPMHEGIRANSPADCRLCGMPLVSIRSRVSNANSVPSWSVPARSATPLLN